MKLMKEPKEVNRGALLFIMLLSLIVSVGFSRKVYAVEGRTTAMDYFIWNNKVTADEAGSQILSTGPISVSRSGDITTISLNDHVLGSLWFAEGGTYVLEANGHAIYPKEQENAIDGNFMLSQDITLTLKGDGVYFGGKDYIIYLSGSNTKNLNIESGSFFKNQCNLDSIKADDINYVRSDSDSIMYIVTPSNVNGQVEDYRYDTGESLPSVPWFGIDYNMIVTQGSAPTTEKLAYITAPLDPETAYDYAPDPTPNSNQGGGNIPNPNPGNGGTPQPDNNNQNTSENNKTYTHTHNFQWIVTTQPTEKTDGCNSLMCEGCGAVEATQPISYFNNITNNVMKEIKAAPEKGTVTIDDEFLRCFSNEMVEEILARPDLTVVVNFTDKGVNYSFTIPAGKAPTDGQEWYGYYYLGSVYGWTLMENVM